jgi:hypothetical protein
MKSYRTRNSLVWGWVSVGLGVIMALSDLAASGVSGAKVGLGLGVCVAMMGTAAYLRPAVVVSDDGVVFKNIAHTASASFSRLADISMRWSLEMHGDDGRKSGAFAVPASRGGRTGIFSNEEAELAHLDEREGRPDSVATEVHDAWKTWQATHSPSPDDSTPSITRRPDAVGLALVIGAVAFLAYALFS